MRFLPLHTPAASRHGARRYGTVIRMQRFILGGTTLGTVAQRDVLASCDGVLLRVRGGRVLISFDGADEPRRTAGALPGPVLLEVVLFWLEVAARNNDEETNQTVDQGVDEEASMRQVSVDRLVEGSVATHAMRP